MKLRIILVFTALLTLTFCNREKDETPSPGYPTTGLSVKNQLNFTIVNSFSAAGPAAPIIAANMAAYELENPGRVVYLALPAASESVSNPSARLLADSIWESVGSPQLYLNTEFLSDNLLPAIELIENEEPILGAAHAVRRRDTAYQVDVKIEFFQDFIGKQVYINCFAVIDLLAKDYGGGINMKLQNIPGVINSSGEVSVWDANVPLSLVRPDGDDTTTILFRKDQAFMHRNMLVSHDTRYGVPGLHLDTINRFGNQFFLWDIFGSQFTPLRFFVPRTPLTDIAERVRIVTLVFTDADGDGGGYRLLNSHITTVN